MLLLVTDNSTNRPVYDEEGLWPWVVTGRVVIQNTDDSGGGDDGGDDDDGGG
jgi:hypothetical protein